MLSQLIWLRFVVSLITAIHEQNVRIQTLPQLPRLLAIPGVVFKHNGNNITAERDSSITLTFSISESCYQHPDDLKSVLVANVTGASLPFSYCQFTVTQGRCDEQLDNTQCTCDPDSGEYNVIIRLRGVDMEVWKVTASFNDDKKNESSVTITLTGNGFFQ